MNYLFALWHDFADSWQYFAPSWIAGWLVAVILALPGVLVVARDQIFIGAAVAQASTCGIAVGFWVAGLLAGLGMPLARSHSHAVTGQTVSNLGVLVPQTCAILAAILAALATSGGKTSRFGSPESRTGWVYLASAAGAVLLLVNSSGHGTRELERLIASSLLGATSGDALVLAVAAVLSLGAVWWARPQLVLLAVDSAWTPLANMRRGRWELLIAIWLGLGIGLGIRVSGLLYSFACLVLPALAARSICREVRSQFWVAPLIGAGTSLAACVIATHHDLPPPQVATLFLCLAVVLAWPLGRLRARG